MAHGKLDGVDDHCMGRDSAAGTQAAERSNQPPGALTVVVCLKNLKSVTISVSRVQHWNLTAFVDCCDTVPGQALTRRVVEPQRVRSERGAGISGAAREALRVQVVARRATGIIMLVY